MAGYLKEKDPNHLVTVGLEGFWGGARVGGQGFQPTARREWAAELDIADGAELHGAA